MSKKFVLVAGVFFLLLISLLVNNKADNDYMNMVNNVRAMKSDSLIKESRASLNINNDSYMGLIQEVRANKTKDN
jgi:uncharacterized membrane protein